MQAPSAEVVSKVLDLLVSPATSIAAIYFYDRFIASKRNGGSKEILHQIDLALTAGFDQLRRDLETKIHHEHDDTRKDWTNALSRFMLELELFVADPSRPPFKRRKGDS